MLEKIGVHFNDSIGAIHWFTEWPMPIAVVLDHDHDTWQRVKEVSPKTILIGRVTPDEGINWPTANAYVEANRAYERIMPVAERMDGIIDFFIQWNEPIIPNDEHGRNTMLIYANATNRLTDLLATQGVRSAVGGFSDGNPRLSFWSYYEPALRNAMDLGGIAHVHEYDWDFIGATYPWRCYRLSQVIWGNPEQVIAEPLDTYPGLPEDLFSGLTWAVTEFGLDRSEGIQKGWKTACHEDAAVYVEQIEDYNEYWLTREEAPIPMSFPQWTRLAGIAIFCKGGGWPDFNIEGPCFHLLAINATPTYYDLGNTTPQPPPEEAPKMITIAKQERPMIGLHLRNDEKLTDTDHAILQTARIESIKAMTNMRVEEIIAAGSLDEPPVQDTIVRIYEPGHPGGVSNFVGRHATMLRILGAAGIHKVEVLNEPNHAEGIEGWGASDDDARDFAAWFDLAVPTLREAVPNIQIGFPGLAVPGFIHRDLRWLDICRPVILQHADWLGCHCYWQVGNRLDKAWGKRFLSYHERFPNLPIHITEFGDSTPNLSPYNQAIEISRYYQMIYKYPYIKSAHAFIQSSPDPRWGSLPFSWTHDGMMGPVVDVVGNMERPPLYSRTKGILKGYKYIGDKLPQHPTARYDTRRLGAITTLVIHHTAIPADIGPRRIAEYHVSKGWAGIGYHFFAPQNKPPRQTQPCSLVSAQCKGHNQYSVGIAFAGMFNRTPPPDYQIDQVARLCANLIIALGLPQDPWQVIEGHQDMIGHHSNACPGHTWKRDWPYWSTNLRMLVQHYLEERA